MVHKVYVNDSHILHLTTYAQLLKEKLKYVLSNQLSNGHDLK